jgi:uncharacterized membrane protein
MSKPKTAERGRQVRAPVPPPVVGRERRRPRPPRAAARRTVSVPSRNVPWRSIVATCVAVAGTCVATYLTLVHYTTAVQLTCPNTGVIDCLAVITSKQSEIFHVPVAVLGLLYFVPMIGLSLPWAWRSPRREIAYARLAMSVVGIGFVFYLLYAELFEIQKICLWCTSVHVLTFVMFVLVVTGWDDATAGWVEPEIEVEPEFEPV